MNHREANRADHPPSCSCVECLKRKKRSCPRCGSTNISYNQRFEVWRCNKCEANFPTPSKGPGRKVSDIPSGGYTKHIAEVDLEYRNSLNRKSPQKPEDLTPIKEYSSKSETRRQTEMKIDAERPSNCSTLKTPKWFLASLFIFISFVIGIVVSFFIKSSIPLWLLLSFSIIYSIEKWFSPITYKIKSLGKVYKLILNLSLLSVLGLLIWTSIKVFSGNFPSSTIVGSCILLTEFIFFIWIWKGVARNSWRRPSMKLTVFLLISTSLILAFAGFKPLADYKDGLVSKISTKTTEVVDKISTKTVIISKTNGFYGVYWYLGNRYVLETEILPNSKVIAGKTYLVELYEKGILRTTSKIFWTQPELNVNTAKVVHFSLSKAEGEAYCSLVNPPELSHIFSIKVIDVSEEKE